jgi:hypothetical protein
MRIFRQFLIWTFAVTGILALANLFTGSYMVNDWVFIQARYVAFHASMFLFPILGAFFAISFVWRKYKNWLSRFASIGAICLLALAVEIMALTFVVFGYLPGTTLEQSAHKEVIGDKTIFVGESDGATRVLLAQKVAANIYHLKSVCAANFKMSADFEKVDDTHIRCSNFANQKNVVVEI